MDILAYYAYEAMLDSIYRVRFYNTLCVYLIYTQQSPILKGITMLILLIGTQKVL